MKISDLISELVTHLKESGDIEVEVYDGDYGAEPYIEIYDNRVRLQ